MERLSVKQTADILKVSEKTVYRWIRQGVIPTVRTQGRYRFDRKELETWAKYKRIGSEGQRGVACEDAETIDLTLAFSRGGIHHNLSGKTPEELFRNAIDQLECCTDLGEEVKTELLDQLLERETLVSTGIGNGIALPHPRHPRNWGLDGPVVGVFFLNKPLDFQAIDQKPVYLFVLILCQTVRGHLSMLSRIAHLLNDKDMQKFLKKKPDAKAVMERIQHG